MGLDLARKINYGSRKSIVRHLKAKGSSPRDNFQALT